MKHTKAYFLENEQEELYELSASKRKRLEKQFPNWHAFNCEDNYEELNKVYEFFKEHGKLVGHGELSNLFVGLTV